MTGKTKLTVKTAFNGDRIRKLANQVARNTRPEDCFTDNTIEGYFEFNGVKVTVRPWQMWVEVDEETLGPLWVPWFSPVRRVIKQWQKGLRQEMAHQTTEALCRAEALVSTNADGKLSIEETS